MGYSVGLWIGDDGEGGGALASLRVGRGVDGRGLRAGRWQYKIL